MILQTCPISCTAPMTFSALDESFMYLLCVYLIGSDLVSARVGVWGLRGLHPPVGCVWGKKVVPRGEVCGGRQRACFTCGKQSANLHREYFGFTRNILSLQVWAQSFPGQRGLTQCCWEQTVSLSGMVREAEELPGQLAQACSPQHVPGM